MTQSDPSSLAVRGVRLAAWLLLPLAAVGVLRVFPPLGLAEHGELAALLGPLSAALLAVAAAVATLLALVRGFRPAGRARDLFEAAALGALGAGAAAIALAGPDGASAFPSAILPIALVAAGASLLVGEVASPSAVSGRLARLAAAAMVFAWIELPVAIGLLATGLNAFVVPIASGGATLIGIAAVTAGVGAREGRRAAWLGGLVTAALALVVGRIGSVDLLPAMVAMAAACATAATLPVGSSSEPEDDLGRPVAMIATGVESARSQPDGRVDEALRLARELRGTIAELIAARQVIDLQRDEIERLRTIDPVTGIATRGAILGRLHAEVAEARRYAHPCAVLMIDLDGMVDLNRERGQVVGDAVLRELALRLRLRVREADAIGRTDGDSFLAILPHTDERGATVFADAVRSRLTARAVETNDGPVSMTVSIGITIVRPGDEISDDEALGRAEEALASARAAGGNRIAFDRSHGLARLDERRSPEATGSDPLAPDADTQDVR
ncbi:MAG TPA: GGDEF domain-containing protein [Candidatus Limnocylindria bacterium]|nr:GGDEF domain-containing protein [Candidatus Limnocylindria bacterium]